MDKANKLQRLPSYLKPVELHPRIQDSLPETEPKPKDGVWKFQVSVPFIAPGAKENVIRAIDQGFISSATKPVRHLEKALREFYKVPMAKACNSGFASLVIGLKLSGVQAGHEVIAPSFTMAAVGNAILEVGAKPVFIDSQDGHLNPSVAQYAEKITPSTRAVIATYTYGVTPDCDGLAKLCEVHAIAYIEDISEAIGVTYKGRLVGTIGDFGCASLYANKSITAGDGGFVISKRNDDALYDHANSLTNHAFVREFHFVHFERCGNYKMCGLAAALATPAIPLLPEIIKKRNAIATFYRQNIGGLSGITCMEMPEFGPDAPWVFGIIAEDWSLKNKLRSLLATKFGIETRDYFFPLHLQPVFQLQNVEPEILPNAERFGKFGFYLPTYHDLTEKDLSYICQAVQICLKQVKEE